MLSKCLYIYVLLTNFKLEKVMQLVDILMQIKFLKKLFILSLYERLGSSFSA